MFTIHTAEECKDELPSSHRKPLNTRGNQLHNTTPKDIFIFCFKGLNSPVLTDFFSLIEE